MLSQPIRIWLAGGRIQVVDQMQSERTSRGWSCISESWNLQRGSCHARLTSWSALGYFWPYPLFSLSPTPSSLPLQARGGVLGLYQGQPTQWATSTKQLDWNLLQFLLEIELKRLSLPARGRGGGGGRKEEEEMKKRIKSQLVAREALNELQSIMKVWGKV